MPTAKDIMNRKVARIGRDATAAAAVAQFTDLNISSLIVDKSNPGDAYGIVTMSDIVNKVVAKGRPLTQVKVHEIMTDPLIWIFPDMSVKHIARLFANNGISRAPVMENNEIVGLITMHDILADTALIDTM